MVPRKKPVAKPAANADDDEKEESQGITIGSKDLHVTLSLNGRGIVLIYALAFAVVVGTLGWVAFQLITALKTTSGATIPATIGFLTWLLTASLSALLLR